MTKLFLDIGGYVGDSVYAALDPLFGFDRIYTFEPVSALAAKLRDIKDERLTVVVAGLFDSTGPRKLFHAGTLAGSVYSDAPRYERDGDEQVVEFIEASEFFRTNIQPEDVVYMKLNCEGAECAILENLFESNEIQKLTEVLVDFDARKIPSQAHRVNLVFQTLKDRRVPFHTPEQVQYGMINNYGGIRNWLIVSGAGESKLIARLKSLAYQTRIILTKNFNGYYKIRVLRQMPWLRVVVNRLRGRAS